MSKPLDIPVVVPTAPVRFNASLALMIRIEEVVAFQGAARDPSRVDEAHQLRIAIKRLRYALELYARSVEGADAILETLKRLQSSLGDVHDVDSLIAQLQEHAAGVGEPLGQDVLERLRKRRARLFSTFEGQWNALLQAGFFARFWFAALAASGQAPAIFDSGEALPPARARRLHQTVAMLRLAPWAASAAHPDGVRAIQHEMVRLKEASEGGGGGWREAARQYARALASAGSEKE